MEAKEASSCDNNKRVEEARRERVLRLARLRRECSSEEEFETARSQPTWTELDSTSCSLSCAPDGPSSADLRTEGGRLRRECASEEEFEMARSQLSELTLTELVSTSNSSSSASDGPSSEDLERLRQENRLHFQHLLDTQERQLPGYHFLNPYIQEEYMFGSDLFFVDCGGKLEVGQKIGGGGQAEIYRAIYEGKVSERYVLKVFRNDYNLAHLQRLWMKNIVTTSMHLSDLFWENYCCITNHGTLLQDGRFAFIMRLCWGDLRKAIDQAILKDKTHRSSVFSRHTTWGLITSIARGMLTLHTRGILHRDLKGENCLLMNNFEDGPSLRVYRSCMVADFDCPEGVVGTRFWRAPEILLAVKNRDLSSHPELWTEKVDVYSYAMTCYEILTGCIPFDGREIYDYDGVICGERPPLPDYVDHELRELVIMCWHSEPLMRPTFQEILTKLMEIRPSLYVDSS